MTAADRRLRLRPLRDADAEAFVAAHRELAEVDGFPFGLAYHEAMPWEAYVRRTRSWPCGVALPEGWVRNTFLVAEVSGTIVGRTSIRHELDDFLVRVGGHIGYCVVPAHRRRGHATEILRQSLVVARAAGVDRVLVTCDEPNVASAATIERCGGVLESVVETGEGPPKRRYWIA